MDLARKVRELREQFNETRGGATEALQRYMNSLKQMFRPYFEQVTQQPDEGRVKESFDPAQTSGATHCTGPVLR